MNENTDRFSDEAFAQQIMQGARTIQPDATFASRLEQKILQADAVGLSGETSNPIYSIISNVAGVDYHADPNNRKMANRSYRFFR